MRARRAAILASNSDSDEDGGHAATPSAGHSILINRCLFEPRAIKAFPSFMLNGKLPANDLRDYQDVALSGGFLNTPIRRARFSKSKDTLRNPIFANPKNPSNASCGSELMSTMAELHPPKLSLPSDTLAPDRRTRVIPLGLKIDEFTFSPGAVASSTWGMHFDPVNATNSWKAIDHIEQPNIGRGKRGESLD